MPQDTGSTSLPRAVITDIDLADATLVAWFHIVQNFYARGETLRRIGRLGYGLYADLAKSPGNTVLDIYHPPGRYAYDSIEDCVRGRLFALCGDYTFSYSSDGSVRLHQLPSDFGRDYYRIPRPIEAWITLAKTIRDTLIPVR